MIKFFLLFLKISYFITLIDIELKCFINFIGMGLSADQRKSVVAAPSNFIRTILGIKGGILIGRVATLVQVSQ